MTIQTVSLNKSYGGIQEGHWHVSTYCLLKYLWTALVNKDVLTLLFAGLSVLLGVFAVQ